MALPQYEKVMFHGKPVTARQKQALRHVERLLGLDFLVPQGSWQPQTSYSGRTHTGAGVVDLQFFRMEDESFFRHVLSAVKRAGQQAAFGRGPADDMPYHLHVCDLDTKGMDPDAEWQVGQWRMGMDGLNSGSRDRYPWRPDPIRRWDFDPKKGD